MNKVKRCIVEVFARTVGFFCPVQEWNKGKVAEFKDRKTYKKMDKEYPPIERDGWK